MKFTDFTGLYSLSKTLRFELKPIGKTLENIKKAGLLEQDQHRADSYKKVKKIIDEYHKAFIEKSLSNFELKYQSEDKLDSLEEYLMYYSMKRIEKTEKDKFAKIQDNLRKQIADHLKGDESYKTIFRYK
jgi:CRISPR-associated protein Cpf1